MRRALVPALLAGLAIAGAARAQIAGEGGAPVRAMSPAEQAALGQQLDAAVQAARASLPVFWERLGENPDGGPDVFGLRVEFKSAQGGSEAVWLQDIKRQGSRVTGRLNYDPQGLPNLRRGDIVPIREADIVDWSFKEGRKRYGEFTTRVMAKAHPEDAAKTLAMLSDNPLPADARGQ